MALYAGSIETKREWVALLNEIAQEYGVGVADTLRYIRFYIEYYGRRRASFDRFEAQLWAHRFANRTEYGKANIEEIEKFLIPIDGVDEARKRWAEHYGKADAAGRWRVPALHDESLRANPVVKRKAQAKRCACRGT